MRMKTEQESLRELKKYPRKELIELLTKEIPTMMDKQVAIRRIVPKIIKIFESFGFAQDEGLTLRHRMYCGKSGMICLVNHLDGICPDVRDCEACKGENI